jgi:hypothetical protein
MARARFLSRQAPNRSADALRLVGKHPQNWMVVEVLPQEACYRACYLIYCALQSCDVAPVVAASRTQRSTSKKISNQSKIRTCLFDFSYN